MGYGTFRGMIGGGLTKLCVFHQIYYDAIQAADDPKPDVVLFLATVQENNSGSNPWLSADSQDLYIDCPDCGKETYNSLGSFSDHWMMNAQCPGPMMLTVQT